LPGMQSAFVDLGLERDAFLYVTDFMELEDSEETDELEKAAAASPNQAPREVRHQNGGGRQDERQGRSGQGQRQEQRQDRGPIERRLLEETVAETPGVNAPASELVVTSESAGDGQPDDSGTAGSRRWRGRRHRRGGRGQAGQAEGRAEQESSIEITPEPSEGFEAASDIQASALPTGDRQSGSSRFDTSPRASREPLSTQVPFVLPGESLSKYGGTAAEEAAKSAPQVAAPARPSGFSKPSTLIESPLEWDGSGLLPGESISRHRTH
jgi:hypothetical protein